MADIKIGIPKKEEVPSKVSVPVIQPSDKPVTQETWVKPAITSNNLNDRAISSMIETLKNNKEATDKVTSIIMASIDVAKFKERLIEEVLRDVQLRNKIMLELLRKL